jgi:UDP-3-O-[3-hydroxymyristoyl] glucosamine N-acyltransferase
MAAAGAGPRLIFIMATIAEIAAFLDAGAALEYPGECLPDTVISGPVAAGFSGVLPLIFVGMTVRDPLAALRSAQAGLAIVDRHLAAKCREVLTPGIVRAVIWSDNPRLDFSRVLGRFYVPHRQEGVHSSAVVSPGAKMGERCVIGPGCVIENGVEIGHDAVLVGRVFLYSGTRLGNRVTIHAGAVIGADGFGYEKRPDGSWQKFPHLGGVVIEDDVEIGANTTIDRGTLGNTVIRRGVKIDNLVHIAHNSETGADSLVIAGAVVCGGASIGERTWVAPQACIREKAIVGSDATIGMGAVINGDAAPHSTMVGWHARPALATKRIFSFLQRIAETDPATGVNPRPAP